MAVFRETDMFRLDWNLMQNGSIVLYYRQAVLLKDVDWFKKHNYLVDNFDCENWHTEADFHTVIASSLDFPPHYGKNLDAFNDCLSDLPVPGKSGRALVFNHYDLIVKRFPEFSWKILKIIASQSRRHMLFGRRLIALVQSDDPLIEFKPVGSYSIDWNPGEWLTKNRGIE